MNHLSCPPRFLRIACGICLLALAPALQAQVIIYNFGTTTNSVVPSTDTIDNMTGSNVSNANVSSFGTSTTNPSSGYTGASGDYNYALNTTAGGAFNITTSSYYTFTLTPSTGYAVQLNSIQFGFRIANLDSTPTNYAILTSADGYASTLATGSFAKGTSWSLYTPTISTVTTSINTALTIRIYVWGSNGDANTGGVRLDDLQVSAQAIPEPSAVALLAISGVTLLTLRRRKRLLA